MTHLTSDATSRLFYASLCCTPPGDKSWNASPPPLPSRDATPLPSYLRWVRNDGLFTDCEVDSDCDDVTGEGVGEDLKCGVLFGMDALNGGVTEEVRHDLINGWYTLIMYTDFLTVTHSGVVMRS